MTKRQGAHRQEEQGLPHVHVRGFTEAAQRTGVC